MKLAGVIYLQSVADNRMKGVTRRNLQIDILRQLCGDNPLARVVLGTTNWGEVDENVGKKREQQLAETFWNSGSKSLRFEQTEVSARAFLDAILTQLPVLILYPFLSLFLYRNFDLLAVLGQWERFWRGKTQYVFHLCRNSVC